MHFIEKLLVSFEKVAKSPDILTKLIRSIFYIRNISETNFKEKHMVYYKKIRNGMYSIRELNCDQFNKKNAILGKPDKDGKEQSITWGRAFETIDGHLNLEILDVCLTVKDSDTGEVLTYHSSTSLDDIEKLAEEYRKKNVKASSVITWE